MVAQFSLLKHLQMLLQHRSLGERNAVNSAKLFVVRSIAPVCARAGEQLCRLDSRNVHNVRTCTQVNKIALLVERQLLALVIVLVYKLYLVVLASVLHQLHSLVCRQLKALKLVTLFGELFHLRLYLVKVSLRKRLVYAEIIVVACFRSRTSRQLCLGVEVFHSLRHKVRCRVPESLPARL